MFVVDIVINKDMLEEKLREREFGSEKKGKSGKFNYVIVGNNHDDISSCNKQTTCDLLIQEGKALKSPVIFTSAKTGDNIDILFEFCLKYWCQVQLASRVNYNYVNYH